MRIQRGRESWDVYTSQINDCAVCFNNHTECRDTCNCFDVALMARNNSTPHDYGVSQVLEVYTPGCVHTTAVRVTVLENSPILHLL